MNWLKKNYPLISILTIGIIIRFLFLLKYGDFWHDEMFSFIYSQKAWPQGLIYWLWETNPPLHLLILKLWFFIFQANEFWARIPSLIFGTTTIISVYFLAKLVWDKNVALISAFFIALHPYNIFWSSTARVYSLLMLLSSLSVYFFYKIFFYGSSKNKDKLFLGLTNTLLLLSHLSSILLIFTQALVIFAIDRKKFIQWFKINLIPFIISASWLIPSFLIKRGNQLEKSWLLNLHHNSWSAISPLINVMAGVHYNNWGFFIISILIVLVLITSVIQIKKFDTKYAGILTFIIIPILITALFGVWHVKMIMFTLPFWVIIISYSINKFSPYKIITGCLIASFCLIGTVNAFNLLPIASWKKVSNYIEDHHKQGETTVLIYNNFFLRMQIDRYLNLPFETYAFDLALEPDMNWDELITQKNYLFLTFSETEIDNWFTKKNLNQYNKIILLQNENERHAPNLATVLEKNNYKLSENRTKASIKGNHYFYTYVKNDSRTPTIQ